jgi:hypothetical protein
MDFLHIIEIALGVLIAQGIGLIIELIVDMWYPS